MDVNGGKSTDFYGVLGLKKECSEAEIKNAYRKLALRWHPDRFIASGDLKNVEDAKKKFQSVQEAYSVLSDANRRFLYDVGIPNSDDDDENGMADFLSEMATMMKQNKPDDNTATSFEELQNLFQEMFESDINSPNWSFETTSFTASSTLFSSYGENISSANKRSSSGMSTTMAEDPSTFSLNVQGFCLGADRQHERHKKRRFGSREARHQTRFQTQN